MRRRQETDGTSIRALPNQIILFKQQSKVPRVRYSDYIQNMESLNYSLLRDFDYLLKYIMIGDASVGKSAMMIKYADGVFDESYTCTIGVDFKMKTLVINGKKVKLQLWDTAGQERFKPITNCYFKGSHGCIVVYDICNRDSFKNIRTWVQDYREQNCEGSPNVIIIGNKTDKKHRREVKKEEAETLARELECEYAETSAKTGENLPEVFEMLTNVVIENLKDDNSNRSGVITIGENSAYAGGCCSSG